MTTPATGPPPRDTALTVVIHRRAAPGRQHDLELAMRQFIAFAVAFPGHGGMHVLRPPQGGRDYTIVALFPDAATRQAFKAAPQYAAWMARLDELTEGDPRIEELTGLETWVTPPGVAPLAPPGKVKMAVVVFLGVYPTTLAVGWLVGPWMTGWPTAARTAVVAAGTVVLLTWVVMPALARLLHRWLYAD